MAGDFPHAVVAQEILLQHFGKLGQFFVFPPASDLAQELRVDILESLRLPSQMPLEPLDVPLARLAAIQPMVGRHGLTELLLYGAAIMRKCTAWATM